MPSRIEQLPQIIIRTGIASINWEHTANTNIWGLPQTVKENAVMRLNSYIDIHGGYVVWFLRPCYRGQKGRLMASCIVRDKIKKSGENDPSDDAMNWVAEGSNTLTDQKEGHKFMWRMRLRDVLYLEQSDDVSLASIKANNGFDKKGKAKDLSMQTLNYPKGPLNLYFKRLANRKWLGC